MKPHNTGSREPFDDVCRFLIKLGKAAHDYGSTSGRLEIYLSRLTAALGYSGAFRVTPTEMTFAFQEDQAQPQRMHMTSLPAGGLDLDKLARVGDMIDDIENGALSLADAATRLDEIGKTALPWGQLANALSYVLIGAGIAVIFAGSWWDTLFAAIFSLVVFGVILLSGRFGTFAAEWLPLTTAFVAAALTAVTQLFIPQLNLVLVTLSAIVVLLPGYTISLGIIELVGQQTVSGTANLMRGLVYLVKQILGAWLGAALVLALLPRDAAAFGTAVNPQWLWLFMPLLIVALCVVFQTSRRDLIPAALGCGIAYGGILLGSALVGGNLGNLLGTVVAVAFANLWARQTGRPTSIVLLPAIILLVSGSIGFRGLAAMAAGQAATGEQQFVQMFIVALTIAAGVFIGNTIIRPKATL